MGMGIRRMGMGIKTWEWEKITAYWTIASCAIHGNSWAVNGSHSCERCIQLLSPVCASMFSCQRESI